jgi:hypothetical protein
MMAKTILFWLIDLTIIVSLIKWLFKTPIQFLRSLLQVGKGPFINTVTKDKTNDPLSGYKVFLIVIVLGLLIWAEQSLFY